jgi:ABC-type iron transport system FetAB permease component
MMVVAERAIIRVVLLGVILDVIVSVRVLAHRVMDAQELVVIRLVKANVQVLAHRVMDAITPAPVTAKDNVMAAHRVWDVPRHVVPTAMAIAKIVQVAVQERVVVVAVDARRHVQPAWVE